jgi:peptidoglycan/xylan/chitin deacetylase (PgdA/CDA1 family)
MVRAEPVARTLLRGAKRGGLAALKAAGAFDLVRRSAWRNQRLLILCYHGVSLLDEHIQDPTLYISPGLFAARLALLRRGGYTVLPLPEAFERLRAGRLPPRSVCLTFDDGMHNFGAAALPLLRRFGFPATVYLTTYYSIHDEPVFDPLISYLLRRARGRIVDAREHLGVSAVWDLRDFTGMLAAFWTVQAAAAQRRLSTADKTGFARRVAAVLGIDFEPILAQRLFHLLRPDEVTALARQGVDFELHTHRHQSPPDRELFLREIRDNRECLVHMVGRAPRHFCYPSGVWRREFLPWLREAGVETATTGLRNLADRHCDPLLLPRIVDCENVSAIDFEAWLTGLPARIGLRAS